MAKVSTNITIDEVTKKEAQVLLADFGMDLSTAVNIFLKQMVYEGDLEDYLRHTNIDYMRDYFAGNKTSLHIFYRRKFGDEFKQVMMEIIPADDYSNDNQSLFLYVNNIEK